MNEPNTVCIIHFVTGGFSGATNVAIDLCRDRTSPWRQILVLRQKKTTDPIKIAELRASGLDVHLVPGWSHWATIWSLACLCKRLVPRILVCHGFPEHLLGRRAGRLAHVSHLVQVEHNSRERYRWWHRRQVEALAPFTDRFIGVSEGVRTSLLEMGLPEERTLAIPNGVDLQRFPLVKHISWSQRIPGLVMSARFSRQKDHQTLIKALYLLKQRGLMPPAILAGGGKSRYRRQLQLLVNQLGLQNQVQFVGNIDNLPEVLMSHQIGVLSSHYEGMPLALLEYFAAGMAVVASDVVGIREIVQSGVSGYLVPPDDPSVMADALERLLRSPDQAAVLAIHGFRQAQIEHSHQQVAERYRAVMISILGHP